MLSYSTGLSELDARDDFERARRAQRAARAAQWLRGRWRQPNHPATLPEAAARAGGAGRIEVISLESVAGTVELSRHFDAAFRPASGLVRKRWERVALAHRRGATLPPIVVQRGPDGYYVADGRHRVSVARAAGQLQIDAWVN